MLDFLSSLVEFLNYWRFYTCAVPGLILAFVIYASIGNEMLGLILSIPVALAGLVIGAVWQYWISKEKPE